MTEEITAVTEEVTEEDTTPAQIIKPAPVIPATTEESTSLVGVDPAKLIEMITELRTENGKKRIKSKKVISEKERIASELAELQKQHSEASAILKAQEDKKKADELEKAGDSEKVALQIQQLTDQLAKKEKNENELQIKTLELQTKTELLERINLIDREVVKAGVVFASEWEREGFVNHLSKIGENGFELNEEEIQLEIAQLKQNKHVPDKTPGAGPKNKQTEVTDNIRLQNLIEIQNKNGTWSMEEAEEYRNLLMKLQQ